MINTESLSELIINGVLETAFIPCIDFSGVVICFVTMNFMSGKIKPYNYHAVSHILIYGIKHRFLYGSYVINSSRN